MKKSKLTPKEAALKDMRASGLDVTVLKSRRTVIVIEDFVYHSVDNGCILNGRRIKKTVHCTNL